MRTFAFILTTTLVITSLRAQNDSLNVEDDTPELSIKGSLLSPLYSKIELETYGYDLNISPEFRLSGDIGVQYRTKKGLLLDARLQSFKFYCKTPVVKASIATRNPIYYDTYSEFYYGQYRICFGMGSQFRALHKHTFRTIIGLGAQVPDQKKLYIKTYDLNWANDPYESTTSNTAVILSPYVNFSYSFYITRSFALTSEINYFYIRWREIEFPTYFLEFKTQHLLSLNIGLTYTFKRKT